MLGTFFNKPVYRVNHIYGHLFSLLLDRSWEDLSFPWIVLTASGGHNELYMVEKGKKREKEEEKGNIAQEELSIEKLGFSLDDASGECFDKVSRMLGGPNPGGSWIEQKAKS
jgi:N6-L-threonylcarbamoyladenine synthase